MTRMISLKPEKGIPEMPMEISRYIKDMVVPGKLTVIFSEPTWAPPTDFFETANEYIIRMEIAGIKPEMMNILLENGKLFIKGRRERMQKFGKCSFKQMEINYGDFERTISIDGAVETSSIRASYDKGFLEIILPKAKKSKPRVISVEISL